MHCGYDLPTVTDLANPSRRSLPVLDPAATPGAPSGLPAFDAARAAAFAHAAAGDVASERWGERGLLATDLADALGAIWARWGR